MTSDLVMGLVMICLRYWLLVVMVLCLILVFWGLVVVYRRNR
jgi:hypothetical protein